MKIVYGSIILIVFSLGILRILKLKNSHEGLILYQNEKGNMHLSASDTVRINYATNFMASNSDKRIMVLPQYPIYYFFSGNKNPTRYDLVIPGNTPSHAPDEINQTLDCSIDYVLFDEAWKFDGSSFSDYNKVIHDKIVSSFYEYAKGPNGIIVYKNKYEGCLK